MNFLKNHVLWMSVGLALWVLAVLVFASIGAVTINLNDRGNLLGWLVTLVVLYFTGQGAKDFWEARR